MMTFEQCLRELREDSAFVTRFNQLAGQHLPLCAPHWPNEIENGYEREFRSFVFDVVWSVLPKGFQEMGSVRHLASLGGSSCRGK